MPVIKGALKGGTGTLKGDPCNKAFYLDLVMSFYALSSKIRKEGLLSLEDVIDGPELKPSSPPSIIKDHHLMDFIRDNLRLMVTGIEAHALEELMDQALETHHEEGHAPINAVRGVGDGMPAFGIVAAVLGVVHTMESVDKPPAELGKLIAAALVGTFLGILLAYGFINPVAGVMQGRLESLGGAYKCAQKGLLCCAKAVSPTMTAEFMRAMIPSHIRPLLPSWTKKLKKTRIKAKHGRTTHHKESHQKRRSWPSWRSLEIGLCRFRHRHDGVFPVDVAVRVNDRRNPKRHF